MEDLKKWIGRKFLDFCKSDPDDEREIHYEMMTGDLSEKLEFTSREIVSMKTMEQIRKSIIRDGNTCRHWTRSAYRGNSYYTWYVNSDGTVNYDGSAHWANRCAPACTIA